jgi:putative transposase
MGEALEALEGSNAANLSAGVVLTPKEEWERKLERRQQRNFSTKEYVYLWADRAYFTIRLDNDYRQCILALIGATKDGQKELVAVQDGFPESRAELARAAH